MAHQRTSSSGILRERKQERSDDRGSTAPGCRSTIVNLSPGMAVTVEIKTRSRRILSYLLSPLLRYQHEVPRQR